MVCAGGGHTVDVDLHLGIVYPLIVVVGKDGHIMHVKGVAHIFLSTGGRLLCKHVYVGNFVVIFWGGFMSGFIDGFVVSLLSSLTSSSVVNEGQGGAVRRHFLMQQSNTLA